MLCTALLGTALLPVGAETAPPSNVVDFSFEQADIRLLIRMVGEITGRQFVLPPEVKGEVTIVAPSRIAVDEVFPLLVSVLESSGYTVDCRASMCHVLPLPERGWMGEPVIDESHRRQALGVQTRVFRLSHISATELRSVLEPMVRGGKEGAVQAFGPTNHLIVTDTAESLERIARLVRELDQPGAARKAEVIALQHASALELAEALTTAMKAGESSLSKVSTHLKKVASGQLHTAAQSLVIPADYANALILVGTPIEIQGMRDIIEQLDIEPEAGTGRLNAVFLQYLSAEEAAASLNALLEKKKDDRSRSSIAVEPDISNNALLVDAAPRDFMWIRELIEQLDRIPQQVLVEVLIVEVGLNNRLDLGVEWATTDNPGDGEVTFLGRTRLADEDLVLNALTEGVVPKGLSIGIASGISDAGIPLAPFFLQALKENKDVNILSRVPLWAQNNKEASVSVVDNIPILKSTVEGGAGTSRDIIQNIERMDVGIKLTMTPHVNPNGDVTLELNPSIEAIVDESTGNQPYTPTIAKREVNTTLTVPDQATIVISGLIRQDKYTDEAKIPLLGDIPVLGALFRRTSERVVRNNLMIFVRPHIVTDMKSALELKHELERDSELQSFSTNSFFRGGG